MSFGAWIFTEIFHFFAIKIASTVGAISYKKFIWKMFDDEGYTTPIENIETSIQYPAFFIYDQDNYHWLYFNDLEEEYNRFLELKTTAENILLHWPQAALG